MKTEAHTEHSETSGRPRGHAEALCEHGDGLLPTPLLTDAALRSGEDVASEEGFHSAFFFSVTFTLWP